MGLPPPEPGPVLGYSYLWWSKHEQGREEGTKDRPCATILVAQNDLEGTIVTVVPITHAPPARLEEGVEIPLLVKRRLGLDEARSWVLVSEANRFLWPEPDLRPISRGEPDRFDYGPLPPTLFRQIRQRFLACAAAQRLSIVSRSE